MGLMKILDKRWLNVVQAIIIVVMASVFITCSVTGGNSTDLGKNTKDFDNIRTELDTIKTNSSKTIELVAGLLNNYEQLTAGVDKLTEESSRTRELTEELKDDNIEFTRSIRAVQDTTLGSELTNDELLRLIGTIERENNYSGDGL